MFDAYHPADLTCAVPAETPLDQLQLRLAADRLHWPVDPPGPSCWTVASAAAAHADGPIRYSEGPLRDQVIACRYRLPDGLVRKSGAAVAKNVAGFAMHRLLCGTGQAIARFEQLTLRLRPLAQTRITAQTRPLAIDALGPLQERLLTAETLSLAYVDAASTGYGELHLRAGCWGLPGAMLLAADALAGLLPDATIHTDAAALTTWAHHRDDPLSGLQASRVWQIGCPVGRIGACLEGLWAWSSQRGLPAPAVQVCLGDGLIRFGWAQDPAKVADSSGTALAETSPEPTQTASLAQALLDHLRPPGATEPGPLIVVYPAFVPRELPTELQRVAEALHALPADADQPQRSPA